MTFTSALLGFTMARLVRKFLCFIFFFSGFALNADAYKAPEYTQYVDEITRSFSKEIKKEFGIVCIGTGGSMPYDVEDISVKFAVYQRATIEEARELVVQLTERFIQAINAHERIRPFLREYPISTSRAIIELSYRKKNGSPYTDGSMAYVFQAKNKIFYSAENPLNPYVYKHIKEEPYEEARAIVLNQ